MFNAAIVFVLCVCGMVITPITDATARIIGVWASGDSEKIFRFQADHPDRQGNTVWDGRVLRLQGLRNEVLAFQVIVEADSQGAENIALTVGPLTHSASGRVIGSPAVDPYGPHGGFEIFSEHYLQVERPTEPHWFYGPNAAPARMTGWIPDALIPVNAPPGLGGLPLSIPPAHRRVNRHQNTVQVVETPAVQNQGFWIDLYLPRDRRFSPGIYTGAVELEAEGQPVATLPLEVTLLPQYLPDEFHSTAWVYNVDIDQYFPNLPEDARMRMLKQLAHRHRIDLVGGFTPHSSAFEKSVLDAYKPYLDGTAFTPALGYHGPGEGTGERLFPIGMYGKHVLGDTQDAVWKESDSWVRWFETNAPAVRYFYYLIDEPGEAQFTWIREQAEWIHKNPGPGSRVPVFITREYTPEIADAVDIWAGGKGVPAEMLEPLRRQGKDHWFYNGYRPRWGSVILEADAVDLRMNAWAQYLYGVRVWFLWHSNHWQHSGDGPKGRLHQRVFTEPLTFINWKMHFGNGDGIIMYPGRMPYYPDEDRGLDSIFPSIRMKNIRRGRQDYEIMWMAEQRIGRQEIQKIVQSVIPAAFNDLEMTGTVPWPIHGNDYDHVRNTLLDILQR